MECFDLFVGVCECTVCMTVSVSPAGVVALQTAVGDGGGGSDKEGQGEGGQEYITAVLPGQGAYVLFLY